MSASTLAEVYLAIIRFSYVRCEQLDPQKKVGAQHCCAPLGKSKLSRVLVFLCAFSVLSLCFLCAFPVLSLTSVVNPLLRFSYLEIWFSPSRFNRSRNRLCNGEGVFGLNATKYHSG
jgi:hypothetical protein